MRNSREEEMIQRLAAYQELPPDALWTSISEALPATVPVWTVVTEFTAVLLVVGLMIASMQTSQPGIIDISSGPACCLAEDTPAFAGAGSMSNAYLLAGRHVAKEIPPSSKAIANLQFNFPESSSYPDQPGERSKQTFAEPLLTLRTLRDTVAKADSLTPPTPTGPAVIVKPALKPKSRLRFYASATPSLSFQKITPLFNDQLIVNGLAPRSSLSLQRFGYSIDAGLQYQLTKMISVYGGATFYRQHQTLTYYYFDGTTEVNHTGDTWSFEVTPVKHEKSFDYSMTNIGMNTGLLVNLNTRGLIHQFGTGLNYQRGIRKGRSDDAYVNSGSNYLMLQVFYRTEFPINDRYSFFIQPNFSYGIVSKENLNTPFAMKPYRAGITIGFLLKH